MIYYKLDMTAMPQVEFACSTSTNKYRNHFDHKGTLEITTVEGCGVSLTVGGKTYSAPPRSVLVIPPDAVCEVEADGTGTVRDDTIAMRIEGMTSQTVRTEDTPKNDPTEDDRVILPMILTMEEEYSNITRLIRTFISNYMRGSATARCRCLSLWFELLACLNSAARRQLSGQFADSYLPSSHMYVRKAKSYIQNHYSAHILIPDVAAELHITPNYLSSMFKQITGRTVLDYIHMIRIQAVKELLSEPRMESLTEIAVKTGLGSARNLCMLFKKTCGVSVREYLRISKELTVYHETPWSEQQEEHHENE